MKEEFFLNVRGVLSKRPMKQPPHYQKVLAQPTPETTDERETRLYKNNRIARIYSNSVR